MIDLKNVPIKDIHPDPNQPRKFYDEPAMQELIQSVKEKGILQPILLRPNGNGFLLVCGERRFRAAGVANLTEIPAVIRELNDDEALEFQIIENLQRKDVHPMEEAVAFKSLLEKGKDLHELAARVGKSDFYVRQRIKLADLSKAWQEIYFHNLIKSTVAIELARFTEKDQGLIYKQCVRKSGKAIEVSISDYSLKNFSGQLNGAGFDKKDPSLNPEMGVCTTCPFNSAVASLFPEDAKSPVCRKIECFDHKTRVNFDRLLTEIKNDPSFVLISDHYSSTGDKLITALQKTHEVLFSNAYDTSAPYDGFATREGLEAVKHPGASKAFYVDGSRKGRFIYIKLSKNSSSGGKGSAAKTKEKIASGKATLTDLDNEIARIKELQTRNKVLDQVKIHAAVLDALQVPEKEGDKNNSRYNTRAYIKDLEAPGFPLQKIDRGIMLFILMDKAGLDDDTIKGIPDKKGENSYDLDYFKKLSVVTDEALAFIVRKAALEHYRLRNLQYGLSTEDTTLYFIAEYLGIDVKGIEKAQAEKAVKREENAKKRLSELTAQKKDLGEKKPVTKKAAVKKKTKK